MGLAIVVVIVLIALTNCAALSVGYGGTGRIDHVAKIFGSLGLVCLLGLAIAFIDSFTQIWVKRPGYEGLPVFIFFYGTAVTTVGSLATTIAIVVGEMRASARSKQIKRERL